MSTTCLDNNLHNNSGTSQAQRALEAMSASYAKVDGRSTADLLLFAKKYGAFLNYYSAANTAVGDWSSFMGKDISVMISSLQEWQGRDYIRYINNLYDNIKSPAGSYITPVNTFKYIFDLIFSIVKSITEIVVQLPADSDYAKYLNVAIASKLAIPVKQLNDDYIFFLGGVLPVTTTNTPVDSLAPFDNIISVPSTSAAVFQSMFSFLNSAPWQLPANVITPQANMFTNDTLNDIITNNFFTGAVTSFLNGVINIVNQTGSYLDKTLSKYPKHSPQYALYLAFIRLFKFAQDHLNNYTERHLEFYYKKVLQLKNDPGSPDTAHLVFTLQKSISQHLLSKGTQFKAGKDANNNDLFYSLTDDIVVNQASVQALKSLYLVKNYSPAIQQQLFASTIANSADGQGGKITSADQSWYPFGDLNNKDFKDKSKANIGFAIASNILFLNEGARTIKITFHCQQVNNLTINNLTNILSVQFTGNKKWFEAVDYLTDPPTFRLTTNTTQKTLSIEIQLNGNAPAIIPYSKKIHGGDFPQALPMVQLAMKDYTNYSIIKSLVISSIEIDVNVDAVKNLSLQNDDGKIDASKPFKPFGEFPNLGASFIIGSKEAFQKPLNWLNINIDNINFPNDKIQLINIAGNILSEKKWNDLKFPPDTNLVQNVSNIISIGSTLSSAILTPDPVSNIIKTSILNQSLIIPEPDFTPDSTYTSASNNGFIRLMNLSQDFNLSAYLKSVQEAVGQNSTAITENYDSSTSTWTESFQIKPSPNPQPIPPSPIVGSVYLSYNATISFLNSSENAEDNFKSRKHFFYHIEPFGFREIHPFLLTVPDETDSSLEDNMLNILPVFNMENNSSDSSDNGNVSGHNNEGELWIALSGTKSSETQSILFQVSDGSSNPLKNVTKVNWFYMSANNWIAFDDLNINDQTHNLSQSGLVIFNLPGDETTNNTRADDNLLWLKGTVQNNTDAVCKIISIQANAAKAQFVTDLPDNIYFTNNIVANTISKPAIADAALKQTSQPCSSFGGRPVESGQQFNQRVSERLRHKHRAVSAWDYERLVLQNFPQVHKVKCLNHTSLKKNTQGYSEMKPGDVMVVTVPDLSLVTGANPLLPFTNVGLLDNIKEYLKPFCSPFVHLHVCNPQFEAVQFTFNVSFINNNANKNYYEQQLDTDIQQFLMPWAYGSAAADIEFGGKIEKSVVLNFVQSRPYVDFVTCFTMAQYIYGEDGTFTPLNSNLEEALATTARSILVPYKDITKPVDNQGNVIISPANCTCNA